MSMIANTSGLIVTNSLIERFESDQKEIGTEKALWKLNETSEIIKLQLKENNEHRDHP